MKILSARPKGMSFESYKEHLKRQKEWLKSRLKPLPYYRSWRTLRNAKGEHVGFETFRPFVGNVRRDLKKPI
ncbi:hypothetical protein [Dysgonomonas sp. ZJ279]|uniref:hypothetical protein n=1 Tax=Dysgonomonas sp. ZJ279 TaxID=2709796 RepID=UPI0013EA9BDB|nr:hypothetical protein [Dysgonomonas sp. ZJ279]